MNVDGTRGRRWRPSPLTATLVAIPLAVLIWGVAIEPRFILDRRDEVAEISGLPPGWVGARVAVIADLQVGMWLGNERMVRRMVGHIVAERPALVLIAGDFVYEPIDEDEPEDVGEEYEPAEASEELGKVEALLRPLVEARIPTYAVLGNHDYGMETRESVKLDWLARLVTRRLTGLGIRVLRNEAVALPAAGSEADGLLSLVGIGPVIPNEADAEGALAQVAPRTPHIVLMHNPDVFGRLPAGHAPLAIAGHTHGGQVRLPFFPRWSWISLVRTEEVHGDGWIHGYGATGNRLYVNRGIGFSRLPIRINCPPELTVFTLRAGRAPGPGAGR